MGCNNKHLTYSLMQGNMHTKSYMNKYCTCYAHSGERCGNSSHSPIPSFLRTLVTVTHSPYWSEQIEYMLVPTVLLAGPVKKNLLYSWLENCVRPEVQQEYGAIWITYDTYHVYLGLVLHCNHPDKHLVTLQFKATLHIIHVFLMGFTSKERIYIQKIAMLFMFHSKKKKVESHALRRLSFCKDNLISKLLFINLVFVSILYIWHKIMLC